MYASEKFTKLKRMKNFIECSDPCEEASALK